MDQKTDELIRELAAKLGTTAEHLWGVLVRQAPVDGAMWIASSVFIAILWLAWWKYCHWVAKQEWGDDYDRGILHGSAIGLPGVVLLVATIVHLSGANMAAAAFINPEYWALMQVMP